MSMLTLFVFDMGYTNRFDMGPQPENTVLNLKFGGKTWFIMVTYLEHLENIISDQLVAISTQLYKNIFFKAGGGIGGNRNFKFSSSPRGNPYSVKKIRYSFILPNHDILILEDKFLHENINHNMYTCEFISFSHPKIILGYLVDGRKNDYKIDFTRFKIRDINTGSVLFEITKPEDEDTEEEIDYEECDPDSGRFVRYRFTDEFLRLKSVGAT